MIDTDISHDTRLHAELVQRTALDTMYRQRAQAIDELLHGVDVWVVEVVGALFHPVSTRLAALRQRVNQH